MDIPSTPTLVILVAAVLFLALCVGVAVLIAACKGLIDVKIRVGLHFGSRQPP